MERRTFIQCVCSVGAGVVYPGCRRGISRAEVLRALIEQVVAPNTAAVAESSRRFDAEIGRLVAEPTLTTLHAAREQWQRALLSWKRANAFRQGPIMDSNNLLRAMFWPVRTAAIEELLADTEVIDDASVDVMGVDRRGLFALEYLLYSAPTDAEVVAGFAAPAGERRARLARALSANVALHADRVARALGDGKAYGGKFAEGEQDSLNRLVLQMVSTVEHVFTRRLVRISELAKSGRLEAGEVEGGRGRMSQQIALTYLRASEQLYVGGDPALSRLVHAKAAVVDERIRAAFSGALSAISNLALPLEEAVLRDPQKFAAATATVNQLERALKTELASALAVTLTFTAVDGD